MNKFFSAIAVMLLLLSCHGGAGKTDMAPVSDTSKTSLPVADYFTPAGDSLIVPSFQIEVGLSQQAKDKLSKDKETIIAAAWFSGIPKDTLSKEYAESGELFLQSAQVELDTGSVASFENIKFSKAKYDSLADKDIRVLINMYSGRHSSPDNLLDCSILSDKMSAVRGQKFVLACKLIGETDSLPK